jgi:hypothetical protein
MFSRVFHSWIGWIVLGLLGVLWYLYGLMLGAFLLSVCGSLRPPFPSFRCAQPFISTVIGGALAITSAVVIFLRILRRYLGKDR